MAGHFTHYAVTGYASVCATCTLSASATVQVAHTLAHPLNRYKKISSELELGIVKEETLRSFQKIIERMKRENGIEAIILGCTELPLLLNDEVSPVPCLDTMKIHVQCLVDRIVE